MKMLFKSLLCLSCLFIPLQIEASESEFTQINPGNVSPSVEVFENFETGEKYATYDSTLFVPGSVIVLYDNVETGERVSVSIEADSLSTYGDSGWSGGSIPYGNHTIRPHFESGLVDAAFSISVSAYPVVYNSVHSSYVSSLLMTSGVNSLYISNAYAGSGNPATASMSFWYNSIGGTINGYLTSQMNTNGVHRITWQG